MCGMFWWNQSRHGHVVLVLPVTWVTWIPYFRSRGFRTSGAYRRVCLYSYRRRRRRGRVVCPLGRTVAFTVCLTLTLRTSQRAISVTLTISSMNRSAVSTVCSCSTSSTATSTGTSNTTWTRAMKCASSISGKPPGNPKTMVPPYQADCLRWITRRYPSNFHQSEAVTWRTGGPIVPMLVKTITKVVALATTNQLLPTPNLLPTLTTTLVTKCLTHRTYCRRNP